MDVLIKALPYSLNILCSVVLLFISHKVNKNLAKSDKENEEKRKKEQAMADGIQSLLRESIVSNYNKYLDKGSCPIYAKESVKRVYKAYHDLGGNDVATELYQKILRMPEEDGHV